MSPPYGEGRPSDPRTATLTNNLNDQPGTSPTDAVSDSSGVADNGCEVQISLTDHLARIGYSTEPQPRTRSKSRCPRKVASRREH